MKITGAAASSAWHARSGADWCQQWCTIHNTSRRMHVRQYE